MDAADPKVDLKPRMHLHRRRWLMLVAGVLGLIVVRGVRAQEGDRKAFKPEELDQMLAPVALYQDALLSQILMAATYPLEVVEAAR